MAEMSSETALPQRRLALVLIDLICSGIGRCGAGFGKYPLGLKDAIDALLPLVPTDDPAREAIDRLLADFTERLSR